MSNEKLPSPTLHQEEYDEGAHGLSAIRNKTVHRANVHYGGQGAGEPPAWSQYAAAVLIAYSLFVSQWNVALTAGQAAYVAADLNASSLAGWFGSTQLCAAAAWYPAAFYLSDYIGRKPIVLAGCAIAFAGNLIASRAEAPAQAIAGLVIIGIGHASQATFLAAMGDIVPVRTRAFFLGIVDIGGSMSQATTTIAGGAMTTLTSAGWRTNFYVLAGANALMFILWITFFHPHFVPKKESKIKAILSIDWIGTLILAAGTILSLVGFNQANTNPWSAGIVVGPMVVGLFILVVAFPLWCWWYKDPIAKRSLFLFWNYPLALIQTGLSGFLLFAMPAFFPIMTAAYFGAGALRTGVLLLAFQGLYVATTAPGTMSITWLKGSFRPLMSVGWIIGAVGAGVMSTVGPNDGVSKFMGVTALLGACSGITSGLGLAVTQYAVIHENLGIGVGLGNTTRAIMGSLAIAIYFTVYGKRLTQAIGDLVVPAVVGAGLAPEQIPAFLGALTTGDAAGLASFDPSVIAAGSAAYRESTFYAVKAIFWITTAFLIAGLISTVLMHPIKPDRMTETVPVRMGKFLPWGGRELRRQLALEAEQREKGVAPLEEA